MRYIHIFILLLLGFISFAQAQTVFDDFEGNGTINSWFGDDCNINPNRSNPFQTGLNTSATVLEYNDVGGQYANVRFGVTPNLDLTAKNAFSIKIYVPSSGLTGNSPNQVSLKLQDGTLGSPWSTQCEIIKPIVLNQWQTVTFDFANDNYINLDPASPSPLTRTDFNRVLIQVNGENNNDLVLAYIDDLDHFSVNYPGPVYNNLVWADEFNTDGAVDGSKWFHQTKLPNGFSWFNGELQHYTNRTDNSFLENGVLHIVAKKEVFSDQGQTKNYTSARLNSKFAFTYGKVEVRAKLPTGGGTWPAIWMLGKNIDENGGYWANQGFGTVGWPACGEIDIMEHWGWNQNFVQSAMHTPSSFGATVNHGGQTISTVSSQFHVYSMEWSPLKMVFSVDGVQHYVYNPTVKDMNTWPFTADQFFLLNVAIESTVDPAFSQSDMQIDYIRVYQESTNSVNSEDISPKAVIFPNPVTDHLTLDLGEIAETEVDVHIYSLEEKKMLTERIKAGNRTITLEEVDSLPAGMYILSYQTPTGRQQFKLVKE